ncbi:sensor histidine kinase [Kitasatospora sp. NBC_01539]|uniref:sensor histidine kinase n=1 Tax=Kitasatospora sp. NBC_01539 TaxID=2903577 RepID=UPI0038600EC6
MGGAVLAVLFGGAVGVAVHAVRSARWHRAEAEAMSRDADRLLRERDGLARELGAERHRLTDEYTRRIAAGADEHAHHVATLSDESTLRIAALEEGHERLLAKLSEEHTGRIAALGEDRERVVAALSEEYDRERLRLTGENTRLAAAARQAEDDRAAALAACANAAGRLQALATGILADLREMEDRHSDETVLGDLLHLDHRAAQAGRIADSVAVLTGARSGRRWARPIGMESILRGAMGRIGGYQRVRVHSNSDVAVAGHAAEGVMHVLAELLDNAANFSAPTAEVHVYVEEVPAGVIVSVEDSGLVMGEVQLHRAKQAVSGESTGLGGLTGTRLGLAVVGRLARKHGLAVSFRPSARGGTGVLVLMPHELLTRVTAPQPGSAPRTSLALGSGAAGGAGRATAAAAEPVAPGAPAAAPYEAARSAAEGETPGAGGLARRQRGQTLAAAEGGRREGVPPRPAPDAGAGLARFSSFRQAVRGTSAGTVPVPGRPEQPDAEPITGRAPAASPHPEGDTPR